MSEPRGVADPSPEPIEPIDPIDPAPAAVLPFLDRLDHAVDGWFDHLRGHPAADRFFYTASELADFSLIWHLMGATRALRSDADVRAAIRLSATLGVESSLVNLGLKSLFKRERPVPEFERPLHLRMPLTSSFPSGHASAAFCAAGLLSDGHRRRKPLYYGLAVAVASSRIHVKIHHASDVLAGAVVGATLAAVVRRVLPLSPRASSHRGMR